MVALRSLWTVGAFLTLAGLLALGFVSGAQAASAPAACAASPEVNRQVVLDFYQTALGDLQPKAAFERYAAPDFVEHKADVPDGTREATVAFLEQLIAAVPAPKWTVIRTVAEGDMVFLHATFSPAPGAGVYVIADVFRLRDCMIVEHWDVVAGPPEVQRNPNPRF